MGIFWSWGDAMTALGIVLVTMAAIAAFHQKRVSG
jgi:hypothetical protein